MGGLLLSFLDYDITSAPRWQSLSAHPSFRHPGICRLIEHRPDDSDCTLESVRAKNAEMLRMCRTYGSDYILIDDDYRVDIDLTR